MKKKIKFPMPESIFEYLDKKVVKKILNKFEKKKNDENQS